MGTGATRLHESGPPRGGERRREMPDNNHKRGLTHSVTILGKSASHYHCHKLAVFHKLNPWETNPSSVFRFAGLALNGKSVPTGKVLFLVDGLGAQQQGSSRPFPRSHGLAKLAPGLEG